jgi:hypothetical protein
VSLEFEAGPLPADRYAAPSATQHGARLAALAAQATESERPGGKKKWEKKGRGDKERRRREKSR